MNNYIKRVINRLPRFSTLDKRDRQGVVKAIKQVEQRGFTIDDAVAFARLTEEYNPNISEESALARMAVISKKYPLHGK